MRPLKRDDYPSASPFKSQTGRIVRFQKPCRKPTSRASCEETNWQPPDDSLRSESKRDRGREGKEEGARHKVTGNMLVQAYKQRVREQKAIIGKAELTKERLLLITSVMRQLLSDENFLTLLRAESIADMPKQLMGRLG